MRIKLGLVSKQDKTFNDKMPEKKHTKFGEINRKEDIPQQMQIKCQTVKTHIGFLHLEKSHLSVFYI